MNWRDHIIVDPDILIGKPVIQGTRISVELILERLADGWSIDDLLTAYPRLTPEDVQAVFAFTAELLKEEDFVALSEV